VTFGKNNLPKHGLAEGGILRAFSDGSPWSGNRRNSLRKFLESTPIQEGARIMDKELSVYFHDILIKRLMEVFPAMRGRLLKMAGMGTVHDPMDEVDRTSIRTEQEFLLHMHCRNERLVREILNGLQRIRTGDFGVCEECGKDIELNRLKAHPSATQCIKCKKAAERKARFKAA